MLGDMDEDGVTSLAAELNALSMVGDLSEEGNVRDMVVATVDALGTVDILINNAGGGVIRPFLEHDSESGTLHERFAWPKWADAMGRLRRSELTAILVGAVVLVVHAGFTGVSASRVK